MEKLQLSEKEDYVPLTEFQLERHQNTLATERLEIMGKFLRNKNGYESGVDINVAHNFKLVECFQHWNEKKHPLMLPDSEDSVWQWLAPWNVHYESKKERASIVFFVASVVTKTFPLQKILTWMRLNS